MTFLPLSTFSLPFNHPLPITFHTPSHMLFPTSELNFSNSNNEYCAKKAQIFHRIHAIESIRPMTVKDLKHLRHSSLRKMVRYWRANHTHFGWDHKIPLTSQNDFPSCTNLLWNYCRILLVKIALDNKNDWHGEWFSKVVFIVMAW